MLRHSRSGAGAALVLIGVAAVGWVLTADQMRGMDMGPGTDLGSFGWFAGVWATMMAAMMLPSMTAVAVSQGRRARAQGSESLSGTLLFALGYLLAWVATGLIGYTLIEGVRSIAPGWLAWDAGGRYVAAAVLLGAAAYELTSLKATCLRCCREGKPRAVHPAPGAIALLLNGIEHAGYWVGCCWALMAALFALGVMSVAWMVVIAVVIGVEKLLPWGGTSRWAVAILLTALGIALAF